MSTPTLGDLTYFANRSIGGISDADINSDRGRNALAAAQQFDPGASYRPSYGSDGQLLGYTLDFDASKMPGANGTGALGVTSGHGSGADFQIPFSTVQDHMTLADPNAVGDSPVYGKVTDNRNIVQQDDWLTKYGPLIIGALGMAAPMAFGAAGLGMGAGAQAAIGGVNGGLGAAAGGVGGLSGTAPSWVLNAAKQIPSMGQSASDGNFNPLSLIPTAGGALGLPSYATTAATTIGNLANGGKLNFNPLQLALGATGLAGKGFGG